MKKNTGTRRPQRPGAQRSPRTFPVWELRSFEREMRDYFGAPIPRPLRIGRLSAALEQQVYGAEHGHGFLQAMARAAGVGGERMRRVSVDLVQEGLFQWIFKVTARTKESRRTMCMVVAKDGHRFSKTASREWELLNVLHRRNPAKVAAPMGSGKLALHTGKRESRLFVYWTGWLNGYWELGLTEHHRFALIGAQDVRLLGPQQATRVRCEILELLASLYDPKSGSALMDVQINSGDFMVTLEPGRPMVRLIAARHLHSGLSGAGLLRNLLSPMGEHGQRPVLLFPGQASNVVSSLMAGLSHVFSDEKKAGAFLVDSLKRLVKSQDEAGGDTPDWALLLDCARSSCASTS